MIMMTWEFDMKRLLQVKIFIDRLDDYLLMLTLRAGPTSEDDLNILSDAVPTGNGQFDAPIVSESASIPPAWYHTLLPVKLVSSCIPSFLILSLSPLLNV